jgi:hypothetical protein
MSQSFGSLRHRFSALSELFFLGLPHTIEVQLGFLRSLFGHANLVISRKFP